MAAPKLPKIVVDPEHSLLPTAVYFNLEHRLVIRAFCSLAGVTLQCRARIMLSNGDIVPSEWTVPITGDRLSNRDSQSLLDQNNCPRGYGATEGFLLSFTITSSDTSLQRGQCWVQAALELGQGAAHSQTIGQVLFSDYLIARGWLGWPGGRIRQSVEPPGAMKPIAGTDPPAGAEISETVPTNARWNLISLFAVLVTDATVIARSPHFIVDDGANILYRVSPAAINATTTANVTVAQSGVLASASTTWLVPLPQPCWMLQGWRLRTLTTNLQPGDNWGAPQIWAEEVIED